MALGMVIKTIQSRLGLLGLKKRLSYGGDEQLFVSVIIVIMQVWKNIREKMFPEKHDSSNAFIF